MAAVLLAYERAEEKPEDLLNALKALPPEEAKRLLLALAKTLPQVAELLSGYTLDAKKEALRLARLLPDPEAEGEIRRLIAQLVLRGDEEGLLSLAVALEKTEEAFPLAQAAVEGFTDLSGPKGLKPLLEALFQGSLVAAEGIRRLVLAFPQTFPEAQRALSRLLQEAKGERRLLLHGLLLSLLRALDLKGYVAFLKESLSEPWEYKELVQSLLRLGQREEALRYAKEGVEWFGKRAETLPLLSVLWKEGGDLEALEARFRLNPSLSDYLALKEELGRAFREKRAALLRRVKDPALLAQILLMEEDFGALDRLLRRLSPLEAPRVAQVIQEVLPQEAAELFLRSAEAKVEGRNRASYEEAAQLLAQAARLLKRSPAELAKDFLARYPRRPALREALTPLLEDLAHPPFPPLP